ncbi:DUF1206 domain-containing protein [Actinacidiphila sp. ITFR-21]|uniref:DUF1206 domain-containing protein n=1 Tax=Actinacidiphila sp. ITFR-21 TaxID=3075199 RepID=UPI00288A0A7D|nr:DUF1206 domain-containing protein [Streptomyces sp. ITFR-21]WNI14456.1 DUF1206 domain-containing protein [Streptomyces sp. ITFR-21]
MSSQVQSKGRRVAGAAARRSPREVLSSAGRAGFVARGVVYVLVGVLALRIAFGDGAQQADRQGALESIAGRPFGTALLWILAAGFACMTLWRAAQAVVGSDEPGGAGAAGSSGRGTGKRLMNAGRSVFYAVVCWGTASFAAGSGGSGSSDRKSKDWTRSALDLPGGRWLVGLAGCGLAVAGALIAYRAARRRFLKKLDTASAGRRVRRVVTVSGVGGGVARGTVFAGAGAFALVAAVRYDPHQAKGVDDTLRSFAHTAAGPWLLVAVAVGLVLFGLFSFASARWRRV